MALIKCSDCNNEVSENAPSCPKCGNPIMAITIEKTSKRWKQGKIWGIVLFIAGVAIAADGEMAGLILVPISFFVFVGSSIGSWWHHS